MFHFLTEPEERLRYVSGLRAGIQANGHVVFATFGPAGPLRCSGLPVVRYDAHSLSAELGHDFSLIDSFLTVHHTPSKAEQQFLYALFRRA